MAEDFVIRTEIDMQATMKNMLGINGPFTVAGGH